MENSDRFKWIDFYTAFATKLLEYKNDRKMLIKTIQEAYMNIDMSLPKLESDGIPVDIDPFTIFGLLNSRSKEGRKTIIKSLISEFSIDANVPDDFSGVEYNQHLMQPFYSITGNRKEDDIDNLWSMFEIAIEFAENDNEKNRQLFCEAYDQVQTQWNVARSLTAALYWVRPYAYINLDYRVQEILKNPKNLGTEVASKKTNSVRAGKKYLDIRDSCLEAFSSRNYPYTSFPELSYKAWNTTDNTSHLPREDDISGNNLASQESTAMIEKSLFSRNMILYGPPGTGKTYNAVNYAVAICESKTPGNIQAEDYEDVLYRFNELKNEGRIAFTTFHQSYGYEEFIEGIQPVTDRDDESKLEYIIRDGIFKSFCERAIEESLQSFNTAPDNGTPRIWGMILGGNENPGIKKQCFENNEIRLGFSEYKDGDVTDDYEPQNGITWQAKHMINDFRYTMKPGDYVVIEKDIRHIDAIGIITGNYEYDESQPYPRKRSVKWLVKGIDEEILPYLPKGRKQLAQFSLVNFDYLGMDSISLILQRNNVASRSKKPFVFIIDEINRGNISKIFGELITLIEGTKREGADEAMSAILPYSGKKFSVPDNVYILGTMNTADRSIALLDTALRRRFDFIEMMPDDEFLKNVKIEKDGVTVDIQKMFETINKRIEILYDREHMIGHAYFKKLRDESTMDNLREIFLNRIIPLLQEYFYDDYEKIRLVLGDNDRDVDNSAKFILEEEVRYRDFFRGNSENDEFDGKSIFRINKDAFSNPESYKKIYE